MEYSMEFHVHGTLVPPNDILLSSMEFHGIFHGIPWNFGAAKWSITYFPGIPWNFEIAILWHFTLAEFPRDIPWNSMELWSRQIKNHRVPWDSMELGGRHYQWHRCSMEFHGIFHGIPWNSGAAKWHITKFHGIPGNIPWNSMELWCRHMKYHLVPWNPMELWDCHFMAFYPGWTPTGYSMEFHGTLQSPNKKSPSSMGFHGIRRAPLQMTQVFHGIPWNIPWNSMELLCRQMKYQLVPWNSMEYSMEFHGTMVPPNDISLSSMEFHGTFRLSFYSMSGYPGIPWDILWNSVELYRVAK